MAGVLDTARKNWRATEDELTNSGNQNIPLHVRRAPCRIAVAFRGVALGWPPAPALFRCRGIFIEPHRGTSMQPLGYVQFTDSVKRPVYELHSRQYIERGDSEPIFGCWFIQREEWDVIFEREEADEPAIVQANPP
jgi:hypothetical protein